MTSGGLFYFVVLFTLKFLYFAIVVTIWIRRFEDHTTSRNKRSLVPQDSNTQINITSLVYTGNTNKNSTNTRLSTEGIFSPNERESSTAHFIRSAKTHITSLNTLENPHRPFTKILKLTYKKDDHSTAFQTSASKLEFKKISNQTHVLDLGHNVVVLNGSKILAPNNQSATKVRIKRCSTCGSATNRTKLDALEEENEIPRLEFSIDRVDIGKELGIRKKSRNFDIGENPEDKFYLKGSRGGNRYYLRYEKMTPNKKRKKTPDVNSSLYTKWSRWSKCSQHCHQFRKKRCRIPNICGKELIKEKRKCRSRKCQRGLFNGGKARSKMNSKPNKVVLKPKVKNLINYNSMFYTSWSDWTSCSHTCLANRYRTCKYSLFCGETVIREEAYCYVKSSACEKWYRRYKSTYDFVDGSFFGAGEQIRNKSKPFQGSPTKDQVIVGHKKYFRDNRLGTLLRKESPIDRQLSSNHRYNPAHQNAVSGSNAVAKVQSSRYLEKTNYQLLYEKDLFFPNIYKETTPPSPQAISSTDFRVYENSPKKTSRVPLNILPEKCGISKMEPRPWSLRIIGGKEASPHKWPWQVAILNQYKEIFCGGTLIDLRWVITAAHCLRKRMYVRLAEHDLALTEGKEIDYKITEVIRHPLYDSETVDNDVALLRLPEEINIGETVFPACIPNHGARVPTGERCTIIGWGKQRNAHFYGTDVLNEAKVPVISKKLCRKVYKDYYITHNMFCAGYLRGRIDSCAGDSGGPLLCPVGDRWYIYGITSFGEGCGKKGKFGIYTKVSNYRTWINDVIRAHAHRNSKPFRRLKNPSPNI